MVFVPAGAMVNHSCVPNCSVSFNGKRTGAAVGGAEDAADGASWDGWGHVSLLTLRDIDAEEELTISYVDAQMTLRERSAALKAMHGFTCRCEKCEVQRGALKLRRATRLDDSGLDQLAAYGLRALEAGLYDDAVSIHRSLLAADRDSDTDGRGRDARKRRIRRRSNALLRMGGALARLHHFDEARATWLRGSEEHPGHAELRREALTARAYFSSAVESTLPRPKRPRSEKIPPPRPQASVWRDSGGLAVHLSSAPLLAPVDCARVIELCEAHAAAVGGWSTKRHTSVPTTDMEVRAVEGVLEIFNATCRSAIFPFLESAYGDSMRMSAEHLRVWDAFVVRYDARAQRSLPTHQDDSHLSLTIALNGTSEYTGGGTSFEAPLTKDPDEGERHVVRPELGHVVAFPGAMRHGGQRVTTGVRYIIAAFLYVSQEPA